MFKTFKIMMVLYCLTIVDVQASLQIAIPARDFCAGNSLILIARDGNGREQVAGCVALNDGKTQFSHDEISAHHPTLLSIAQQESANVFVMNQNQAKLEDDSIIYLYFEVDPTCIVRVLMIKNNFLADNPFDVVEFSAASYLDTDDDEDEDDCFDMMSDDELSHFNLTDLEPVQPIVLSNYDKMTLAFYAVWAVQSEKIKQTYKNLSSWIYSEHAK
jgi:hypothetical protein